MKKHNERLDYTVSACLSFDIKKRLYEIAELEKTTVSDVTRKLLEKAVSEYKEV